MLTMRWAVVLLIFRREVRDQLRDRRTLFMIFALPILLYPMLGLGMAHLMTLTEKKPRTVILVGADRLPESPALLNDRGDRFHKDLFDVPGESEHYHVRRVGADSEWARPSVREELLRRGKADVVVVIPDDIEKLLTDESRPFRPALAFDSAEERGRDAALMVREVFSRWNEEIIQRRLARDAKPASYLEAVRPQLVDVARTAATGGSVWARLFPFLLVMMSLTGAFYPAVDLCAGEKERGTMETLLISPATRPEIVTGKFLTVMLASMATAILNLASMGLTALQLSLRSRPGPNGAASVMTPPTLESALWMIVLLVPLSAFFSALCVALAAMARSMKEGQYYLTPLYLIALPLIFASLTPGIELNLFTSLVPVTGASLLLRALMLAKYEEARRYFLPVLVPLLVYGAMALRWAVSQFQREAVLFREAEKFDLKAWLIHLVRDREPTPRAGQALLCFVLMLVAVWFSLGWMEGSWTHLIGGQIVYVLLPPLLLTLLLTSSPRRTLRLRWPSPVDLLFAVSLALALNPVTMELGNLVERIFPLSEVQRGAVEQLMASLPGIGTTLLVFALIPAICEEVAFRGFILTGLEDSYRRWSAVILSAFLFGFMHVLVSVFQQLFGATLLGLVLALLAIRSRSLLPGIVFHAINNGLAVVLGALPSAGEASRILSVVFRDARHGLYHVHWIALGGIVSSVLLVALGRDANRAPATADEGEAEPISPESVRSPHDSADADAGRSLSSAGRGGSDS